MDLLIYVMYDSIRLCSEGLFVRGELIVQKCFEAYLVVVELL